MELKHSSHAATMVNLVNLSSTAVSTTEGTATAVATALDLANGIGNLNGATVKIATGFNASQDQLGIAGQAGLSGSIGAIAWSYSDTTGTLTFSGDATEAAYEAALQQVVYTNTSGSGTKSVQIAVSKLGLDAERTAYYEYVGSNGISWQDARTAAAGRTFLGATGFLATLTSAVEQTFVNSLLSGNAWLGASDEAVEGEWRWVTGPEAGTQFWQGNFTGSVTGGSYANWLSGEPNNAGPGNGDDYMLALGSNTLPNSVGNWYDEVPTAIVGGFAANGYLVDYGAGFVNLSTLLLTVNAAGPGPGPDPDPGPGPGPGPIFLPPVTKDEIFNFKQFAAVGKFAGSAVAYTPFVVNELSIDLFFDEVRYIRNNQDIAVALQSGQYASGYDHFVQFGWKEQRDFTSVYNESYYLANNADVAQAVASGAFSSGFEHFAKHGHQEWRDPSALFNKRDYLTRHTDVSQAVDAGVISSAFEHWTEFGSDEMRTPQLMLFQENFYLEKYTDVKAAVQNGIFASGLSHYAAFGAREGRDPSAIFDESAYFDLNPDVRPVVQSGALPTGLSHYVLFGRSEGRAIAPAI
jgi:Lectin C-type domain